jgi:predicted metal-dependent phosphoesterase TrpH
MIIDMHNHTRISSSCSLLSPEELIETARVRGLDGICVTEHSTVRGAEIARKSVRKNGFPVFRGIEARTDLGDMLVYGYYRDIPEGISLDTLCRTVHEAGGVLFAAHPFHLTGGWNLFTAMQDRGLDLEKDWNRLEVLRRLDGIEVINGNVSDQNNAKARELADRLGIGGIGGSDAHIPEMVARAATRFDVPVRSDEELIAALKTGAYQAVRLGP